MMYQYLYVPFEDEELDTEAGCIAALYRSKWPSGFCCPRCNHGCAYVITTRRLPLYECRSCRAQTSLIAGTIMEGSRTSLTRWFMAIHHIAQIRTINAVQLADIIGVTYKTAWLIYHKIREAMIAAEASQPLTGDIRVTDLLIRSIPMNFKGNFQSQEQVVTIGTSDNQHGLPDRIKLLQQPKEQLEFRGSPAPTEPFFEMHVHPDYHAGAMVIPRINQGKNKIQMRKLRQDLYKMGADIELWLSFPFGGIKPKHFQRYLSQYGFRWNRRVMRVFDELLQACSVTKVITYPVLTQNPPVPSTSIDTVCTLPMLVA